MEAQSSWSASTSKRKGNPAVPLIVCPDCGRHTVLELKVRTNENGNQGRIFYTCPSHKKDGTGCPFWRWEEAYVAEFAKNNDEPVMPIAEEEPAREPVKKKTVNLKACEQEMDMSVIAGLGNEIIQILKFISCVCVGILICNVYYVIHN
ncbi:hypothetical protein BS78_05G177900 [Paspalum vaginatum]|nr:hypothetical protein BS78_05G177900 [Paspalum vaginatum]